jgi:hypothetical protein
MLTDAAKAECGRMFEQEKEARRRALAVADERSKENVALREMLRAAKREFECLRNWMDRAAASDYRYRDDPALRGHREAAHENGREDWRPHLRG